MTVLSGESVEFTCTPSDDTLEMYWTYETNSGIDNVTVDSISQTKFLSDSLLLHQLLLPIAAVNDTGNYTCIVRGPPGNNIVMISQVSQTISLNVSPGKYICTYIHIYMYAHICTYIHICTHMFTIVTPYYLMLCKSPVNEIHSQSRDKILLTGIDNMTSYSTCFITFYCNPCFLKFFIATFFTFYV